MKSENLTNKQNIGLIKCYLSLILNDT
jgi:hypothetical protein